MFAIGTFLKELREEKKLTQEELSNKLFIDRTTITKLENNQRFPTIEQLVQYSEFFDISVSEILNKKKLNNVKESNSLILDMIKKLNSKDKKIISLIIIIILIILVILSYILFSPRYYEISLEEDNSNIKELSGYFIEDSSNYTYYINVELINPKLSIWSGLYTKKDDKYNIIEGYTKGITEEGYYQTNRTFYGKVNKTKDTTGKHIIKNKDNLYLCLSEEYLEEVNNKDCYKISLEIK